MIETQERPSMGLRKKAAVAATGAMVPLVGFASVAGAQGDPYDPTAGAFDTAVTDMSSFVTSTAGVGLIALTVIGVGFGIAQRYLRKGGKAV